MKKILVFTSLIKPGGGPPGYTYNMMMAYKKGEFKNNYQFLCYKLLQTNSSAHSISDKLSLKMKSIFSHGGIYLFSKKMKEIEYISSISDISIVHGVVHPNLMYRIRKNSDKIIFMPHSPSVMCDEYIMSSITAKKKVYRKFYTYFKWAEHACMAYADILVFPSERAADPYKIAYGDIFSWKDVVYIPSGVDVDFEFGKSVHDKVNKKITVSFIGRYNKHKGYDLFCKVAEKFSGVDNVRFISAGSGPIKPPSSVVDYGWCENIEKIFLESDIIIVPNRVAYYDLLPLEAAAYGLPIVFTPVGGNVDQAEKLVDVILAKSVDENSIFDSIVEAMHIKMHNPNWGVENRKIYLKEFTAVSMMKRWDDFLSTI